MNNLFCINGGCFKCIGRIFTQWVRWKKLESIPSKFPSSKKAWIFLEQIFILFWAFINALYQISTYCFQEKKNTCQALCFEYVSCERYVYYLLSKFGFLEIQSLNTHTALGWYPCICTKHCHRQTFQLLTQETTGTRSLWVSVRQPAPVHTEFFETRLSVALGPALSFELSIILLKDVSNFPDRDLSLSH